MCACAHAATAAARCATAVIATPHPDCLRATQVTGNTAVEKDIKVGGTGNYIVDNAADYMYLGGAADGSGSSRPLINDVVAGNTIVAGGNADKNSLWMSSDTSSKYINNELQDYLFVWGGAQNDVEDNTERSFKIARDIGSDRIQNNTYKDNVLTDKTIFSYGASSAAARGRRAAARCARPAANGHVS
jgi:hypothetical protein